MGLIRRPVGAAAIGVVSLAMTAFTAALAAPAALGSTAAMGSVTSTGPRFAAVSGSLAKTTDHITGSYSSRSMLVEVVLKPSHGGRSTGCWRLCITPAVRSITAGFPRGSSPRASRLPPRRRQRWPAT